MEIKLVCGNLNKSIDWSIREHHRTLCGASTTSHSKATKKLRLLCSCPLSRDFSISFSYLETTFHLLYLNLSVIVRASSDEIVASSELVCSSSSRALIMIEARIWSFFGRKISVLDENENISPREGHRRPRQHRTQKRNSLNHPHHHSNEFTAFPLWFAFTRATYSRDDVVVYCSSLNTCREHRSSSSLFSPSRAIRLEWVQCFSDVETRIFVDLLKWGNKLMRPANLISLRWNGFSSESQTKVKKLTSADRHWFTRNR